MTTSNYKQHTMQTLITITESRTMPGSYEIAVQPARGRATSGRRAGQDPAGAAAIAVEAAISHGAPYMIFAPGTVLAFIPPEIRTAQRS